MQKNQKMTKNFGTCEPVQADMGRYPSKYVKPFPKRQILDSSNLKEFADDNFKSDRNSRKFSKRVENTLEKGEIARYEQFLLFPQCFQKNSTPDT